MLFRVLLVVFIALKGVLLAESTPGEGRIWVLQQDFVKTGKREAYESFFKEWLQKLKTTKGKRQSRLVFQDLDSLQFIHLIPFENYGEIQSLYSPRDALWSSLINFQMRSIHRYLPFLSFLPPGDNSFSKRPHLYYIVYGIAPGNEAVFEKRLKDLVGEHRKNKSTNCWRVWRVEFGSDVPKYLVALFAQNKEDLDAQVEEITFVEPMNDEIIRRKREGRALFRPQLSFISNDEY